MSKFNPEILSIARGSRGLSQSEFAEKLDWSQGKASKVEHGLIQLTDEEVCDVAAELRYPVELFYQQDAIRGFGSCCLYHRKRASTPVRVLNQLHDTINIRRIQLGKILRHAVPVDEPHFPSFDIDEYERPDHIAQMVRVAWGLPRGPIANLADAVEVAGGIILETDLITPKIDAVSQRAVGLPPVFFLNQSSPADRRRWTLAHEIGHVVMHRDPSESAEREADEFSSELLMPAREIKDELRGLTIPRAAALKLKWRVSMQALIRRAKDVGAIGPNEYQSLCVRISQLGYRKSEPNPIQPEPPKMLRMILDSYLRERGYSVPALSAAMLSTEDEFRSVYLSRPSEEPRLRVID